MTSDHRLPSARRDRPGRGLVGRARARGRSGVVTAALLVACGGEGEGSFDSEMAPGPAVDRIAAEIQQERGPDRADARLVIAVRRVPDTLDPLGDMDPWGARVAEDLVFEGLTRRVDSGAPWAEPALADQCVARPEAAPRDVYCHLRDDAVFHDGEPVGPNDVLYSLSWWLDSRRSTMRLRQGLGGLRKVEMVDGPPGGVAQGYARDPGRWAHVSFSRPEPLALERLADLKVVPRGKHRGRARAFGRQPIGTGPMRVTTLESNRLVLEPWAAGEAEPERPPDAPAWIDLREMADGARVLTAMRQGDVHLAADLSPSHVPEELAKPGMAPRFSAYVLSPPRYDLLLYNLRRGVQAGPKMRGVLDDTIGRAALADALGDMPSQDTTVPVDTLDPVEIDLQALFEAGVSARWGMAGLPARRDASLDDEGKARALATLDQLEWVLERGVRRRATGSLRVVLMWSGASSGDAKLMADAVRDDWREAGIIVPYATAGWSYLLSLMRKGEFDVALLRLASRSDADLHAYFHSRGDMNLAGVADVALDEALEAYRAAATPKARREARDAVAQRLAQLRVTAVLRAPTEVMLASSRVHGLEFEDDLPRLDRLRLAPIDTWILGQRGR